MTVEAPCRIRERFSCDLPYKQGRFYLTGLNFFAWSLNSFSPVTLYGKKDPQNKKENTSFFDPKDVREGINISFEIPDGMIVPGYPLRELGLDTDAVGWLHGLTMEERGWSYYICYGRSYGVPLQKVRTAALDKLFDPVLPPHAVEVDYMKYLLGGDRSG